MWVRVPPKPRYLTKEDTQMKTRNVVMSVVVSLMMAGCYTYWVDPEPVPVPEPVPYVYYYPDGYWIGGVFFGPGWYHGYHQGRHYTHSTFGHRPRSTWQAAPRPQSHGTRSQGHRR